MGDHYGCVGEGALDVADGLFFVFIANQATDLEWEKTGGVEMGCGCGCRCGGRRSKCPFFDCLSMDFGADVFISRLVKAAHVFILSWNGVRLCCAYFICLHVDNYESVFGKFAACEFLMATELASLKAALKVFVFPHIREP